MSCVFIMYYAKRTSVFVRSQINGSQIFNPGFPRVHLQYNNSMQFPSFQCLNAHNQLCTNIMQAMILIDMIHKGILS